MESSKADTRNLHWKQSNVGSKLLQKMGWQDGEAVGKRQRNKGENNNNTHSTEGLRAKKRKDGLGIGANSLGIDESANATNHASGFEALLASLNNNDNNTQNNDEISKAKKINKKTKTSNRKPLHGKAHKAKFEKRSAHDMKCIFGDVDFTIKKDEKTQGNKKKKKSKKKKKRTTE